jgi:hypothetical protein
MKNVAKERQSYPWVEEWDKMQSKSGVIRNVFPLEKQKDWQIFLGYKPAME